MIIVVLPFQVFYLVHTSLLVLTLSYVISFLVTRPTTYECNAIIGSSSMAIFLPINSALYVPMVIQYLYIKDKPSLFHVKRLEETLLDTTTFSDELNFGMHFRVTSHFR